MGSALGRRTKSMAPRSGPRHPPQGDQDARSPTTTHCATATVPRQRLGVPHLQPRVRRARAFLDLPNLSAVRGMKVRGMRPRHEELKARLPWGPSPLERPTENHARRRIDNGATTALHGTARGPRMKRSPDRSESLLVTPPPLAANAYQAASPDKSPRAPRKVPSALTLAGMLAWVVMSNR